MLRLSFVMFFSLRDLALYDSKSQLLVIILFIKVTCTID